MSSSMFNRFAEFPQTQVTLTPDNSNDLTRPMIIYCGTAGTIKIADKNGTLVIYTVVAGEILPVLACRVYAADTTVTQVIGLY